VTLKESHEIVRTGPYRRVRHPIYTGLLLAFAGTECYVSPQTAANVRLDVGTYFAVGNTLVCGIL
jgi:protein-S-isoprenylcysteine O-methyltransferase Ste14